jgi:hypothetical protein
MNKTERHALYMRSAGWQLHGLTCGTSTPESTFKKADIFHKPFKNFGRVDDMSKSVCSSIAIALHQEKLYPSSCKLNIPIYFGLKEGPIASDYAYYSDFLKFGGRAGRANLFIYTLPSSPLGEASVHFGLTGNLLFVNTDRTLYSICQMVKESFELQRDKYCIIGLGEREGESSNTLFMLFERGTAQEAASLDIDELSEVAYSDLNELSKILQEKGQR